MAKTKTIIIDDSKVTPVTQSPGDSVTKSEQKRGKSSRQARAHGKKYIEAKNKIDAEKLYPPQEAVKLARETSISSFGGSFQLHLVIKGSFNKVLELPYEAGKAKRVEVATDETIEKLSVGKIDFDVLIASPDIMSKLVPFAKLLGPRGLMPNPKNGTLSAKPEEAAKKFAGNSLQIKSEPKAPLIHTVVGKVNQSEEEVLENLKAVINAVGPKNIEKAVIAASMGPAVKLAVA